MGGFVSLECERDFKDETASIEKRRVGFEMGVDGEALVETGGWVPQIEHLPEEAGLHAFQEAEARACASNGGCASSPWQRACPGRSWGFARSTGPQPTCLPELLTCSLKVICARISHTG